MKRFLCFLITLALVLAGCASTQQSETTEVPSDPVESVDPHALRLTQEENVRRVTYENKDAYAAFLAKTEKLFVIPGLKQVLTPQGIAVCPTTGRIYISSYSVDGVPSSIAVVDPASYELVAEYYLYDANGDPFTSHVGGVAVTDTHMYVSADQNSSGEYRIAAIPMSALPAEGSHEISITEYVTMAMSPSMLNYSNGYLWVGNFYYPSNDAYVLSPNMAYTTTADDGTEYGCYILGFDMAAGHDRLLGGSRFPIPDVILAAPDRIQGITFTGGTNVVLSQSYGRANDATLLHYQVDLASEPDLTLTLNDQEIPAFLLDGHRLVQSILSIPMTEGLATMSDGRVLVLYESGAIRYEDGKHRTSYVWALTPEESQT